MIVTTFYCPVSILLSIKWSLTSGEKQKKISNFALKVAAVSYERQTLTRGSKYSDLPGKLLVFCKNGS